MTFKLHIHVQFTCHILSISFQSLSFYKYLLLSTIYLHIFVKWRKNILPAPHISLYLMKSLKIVLRDTVFEMDCDMLDRFQFLMKQLFDISTIMTLFRCI